MFSPINGLPITLTSIDKSFGALQEVNEVEHPVYILSSLSEVLR